MADVIRTLLKLLGVSITVVLVGLLGAWAFNPDNGSVTHSELLWRFFGAPAEVSLVATPVLVVVLLLVLVGRSTAGGIRRVRH
jgi:hypothetical protein